MHQPPLCVCLLLPASSAVLSKALRDREEQRALQGGGVAHRKGKPLEGALLYEGLQDTQLRSNAMQQMQRWHSRRAAVPTVPKVQQHTIGLLAGACQHNCTHAHLGWLLRRDSSAGGRH
jgi:hypothetical protein